MCPSHTFIIRPSSIHSSILFSSWSVFPYLKPVNYRTVFHVNVCVYAFKWTQKEPGPPESLSLGKDGSLAWKVDPFKPLKVDQATLFKRPARWGETEKSCI
ncbi:hypothetical protein XENOCAPTIV_005064 [Xenoophorus captivus]|uniref:Uncharacterized protein n=1 Tax=Xenoophorus captivus TaxID=1517983 RepID=A0ABV0RK39_9TELE